MRVSAVHEVSDEIVQAVQRLVPQLSSTAKSPSRAQIEQLVKSGASTLLIARDDEAGAVAEPPGAPAEAHAGAVVHGREGAPLGAIVGMLTLAVFRIPTGVRAWIEDVVVDEHQRGHGVGEALTQAALELAASMGARTVDLTSRPSRDIANRLYKRMGFELRETNVYRRRLD
ncbi:MAG: GNAT family N-acetyltransferase [Acidimicrobiales bacterium]